MKQLIRNIKIALVVLLVLTIGLGTGLVYQQYQSQTELLAVAGENKASLRTRYAQAGSIVAKDGVILAQSEDGQRQYAEDIYVQLGTSQLVGDYTHHMSNTIETQYQGEILGNKRGITEQLLLDLAGRGLQGDDVHLTVQGDLSSLAYQELEPYDAGALVLMNYKTGEILASVSTPATEMSNIIRYEDIPDTALFNRALNSAYQPASTFKVFTSAAWLTSPNFQPDFTLECSGEPLYPGGARDKGHGLMDLNEAFAASCNVYFGELANKMGEEYFSKFLNNLGLDKIDSLDRLDVRPARYDISAGKNDAGLLSWAGAGQPVGNLIAEETPLHLALVASAVAGHGDYPEPYVVEKIVNPLQRETRVHKADKASMKRMFAPELAIRLEQLMIHGVESSESVQYNAAIPGVKVAGKSGTLERESVEGYQKTGLWMGFLAEPNYPFAVAVVIENVETSNETAVVAGRNMLQYAMDYGIQ